MIPFTLKESAFPTIRQIDSTKMIPLPLDSTLTCIWWFKVHVVAWPYSPREKKTSVHWLWSPSNNEIAEPVPALISHYIHDRNGHLGSVILPTNPKIGGPSLRRCIQCLCTNDVSSADKVTPRLPCLYHKRSTISRIQRLKTLQRIYPLTTLLFFLPPSLHDR